MIITKKKAATLDPYSVPPEDALLVDERCTEAVFSDVRVTHAIVSGMRMIGCTFRKVDFSHSVFVACHFRRCRFEQCNFTNCRFVGSEFPHSVFSTCRFPYSKWRDTTVPADQIVANLPFEWPNASHELLESLRLNALSQGDGISARAFLFRSMAARRIMLKEIVLQRHSWYRDRFGFFDRIKAGFRLVWSIAERWVWGYGERPLLTGVWGAFLVLGFGVAYLLRAPVFFSESIPLALLEAVRLSSQALAGGAPDAVPAALANLMAIEGLFGIIYTGVVAAVVYRWISVRSA